MKKDVLSFFLAAVLMVNAAAFSFNLSDKALISHAEEDFAVTDQPAETFVPSNVTEYPLNTEMPDMPEVTETPEFSETPEIPEASETPEAPETPELQVTDGASFKANVLFRAQESLETTVKSFEAAVCFPCDKAIEARGGIILGNYDEMNPCVSFEIFSMGNPRIYVSYPDGSVLNWVFNEINVYTGRWEHLAFVYSKEEAILHCYINGELKQSLEADVSLTGDGFCFDRAFCVGGDLRTTNNMYFTGRLKTVAVYSAERSAEEIAEAYRKFVTEDFNCETSEALIAAYYFDDYMKDIQEGADLTDIVVEDMSGKGLDVIYDSPWMKEKEPVREYDYSFAVVGDTQILSYHYPEKMDIIYDWISDNVEEKNIKLVMGLGDITDKNSTEEWAVAYRNIKKLDGLVPYTIVRGNHDAIEKFTKTFEFNEYKESLGGSYGENMLNTWRIITVGETKYLIMCLDYGPSDDVLRWADEVVMSHHDCNIIVTTHAYLFRDGTTLDIGDVCPPSLSGGYNNGDDMWEKFVSKHSNIVLVLSGHDSCDRLVTVQTEGINGNKVTQILVDPQGIDSARGAAGMVAMLYFSENGKQVEVEYFSTVRDMFFMEENQFNIALDTVEPDEFKSITSIEVKTNPLKTRYKVGESFDVSGGSISVNYDDGSNETVVVFEEMLRGGYDGSAEGEQKVAVEFAGFEAYFEISVYTPVPSEFTGMSYDEENGIVKNVSAGVTVASFLEGFEDKRFCKVFLNGRELADDEKICTGAEVRLMDGENVNDFITVSVRGDVNGDGKVSVTDMLSVKSDILGKNEIEISSSMLAADVSGDGKISITDFLKIKAIILGKE